METFFTKIVSIILTPIIIISGWFGGDIKKETAPEKDLLGASLAIPTPVALFETSLASAITSSATSFTLTSATDKDGNALASSTYAFIIDEGTASEEFVIADCTSTACTNASRGISALTGTSTVSALQKSHRRGASVKITDGPQLLILSRILNGVGTVPNIISYASHPTFNSNTQIIDKKYADDLAIAGAPDASETVEGIVELATGLEAASSTSSGTLARLVVPASIATDTPTQSSVSGSKVVMSAIGGYIKQAWIDLTETFSWTNTHTWTGANGKIGIGTSTPYAALSVVSGTPAVFGTIHATSTASGNATSTFSGNVVIGNNASTTNLTISTSCTGCISGYEKVTNTGSGPTGAGTTASVTATCTAGKTVVGGGGSNNASDGEISLFGSYPNTTTTWIASYVCYPGGGGCAANTITSYAICINQ